jgi:GDPmannose 4,6-dehydratase
MKTALITGIGGQDGSYLAELLLEKGYRVHGIELPSFSAKPESLPNLTHLLGTVTVHFGSMVDEKFVRLVLDEVQPDECYHFAASSFVSYDFDEETSILNNNVTSVHTLLSCLKKLTPKCRIFFAGTSEMFGQAESTPQNENTPLHPRSVYGISKVTGYHLVNYYRLHHGSFACTGFLYNHESVRRSPAFVTRKITSTVAKIKLGLETKLVLGNLDAKRDWGYAPDYVNAMWLMLQQEVPVDYVIATGENRSVREFVETAFNRVGLGYQDYVEVDSRFYREAEKVSLCGDSSRLQKVLGWQRQKSFSEIVEEMVDHDLQLLSGSYSSGRNK